MKLSCMSTFENFRIGPRIMALMKYFKRIKLFKKEKIQSAVPKLDCPSAHLMPSSAIKTVLKASAIYKMK